MNGLSADYLPPGFVALLLALRYVVLALVVLLPLAVLVLPRLLRRTPRSLVLPCAMLQALAMFFMAIPFHQVPDEVFVSLTQSRNLAEHGRYSFYPDRNVDGTGDGLFYVAVGGLHAAGIPAPLGALLLGAACGAAAIGLLYRHAFDVTQSHAWAWLATLLASVLECFGRLAGSGWSASMLGLITIASILLWRSSRWPWTFLLTGLLPFCRYDFSFYTVTVGALLVFQAARSGDRPWRRVATFYATSLAGVAALLLLWRMTYGHFVPTCILMKAGSYPDAAAIGDSVFHYARELWPFLLLILGGVWFTAKSAFTGLLPWLAPGTVHFALVLWGGGDYFPGNRYQIVLTVAVLFAAIQCIPGLRSALRAIAGREEFPAGIRKSWWIAGSSIVLLAGIGAGFRPYGTQETWDGLLATHRKPDRSTWLVSQGLEAMTVSRLNNHALTGRFFSRLTQDRPGTRMASLEVASAFYFFDGTALDVQGFVDRNVATGPRHPKPRRKWDKRLDPAFWERERPEIIWLDTTTEVLEYMKLDPFAPVESMLWWSRHFDWTQPYFENDYLRRHYKPRATRVNGDRLILWLAREDVALGYDLKLASLGFTARTTWP